MQSLQGFYSENLAISLDFINYLPTTEAPLEAKAIAYSLPRPVEGNTEK